MAIGRVASCDVIVSGGDDRTVQVWDAATGTPIGDPLFSHTNGVTTVAIPSLAALVADPRGLPDSPTWR